MRTPRISILVIIMLTLISCAHKYDRGASPMDGTAFSPDGTEIAWDIVGNGDPALVFVHCWACDRSFWKEQIAPFSKTHTVVTLDLAGHGESSRQRTDWTIASLADDVVTVVEHLNLDDVILIGHSMGGSVALDAAAKLAGRVEGVVLVDTVHNADQTMDGDQAAQIVSAFENDFDETLERFTPLIAGTEIDPSVRAWILERAKRVDHAAAKALMRDLVNVDNAALLRGARVPVRAINAAPAPPMRPATEVEINRRYADFDAVLIDGVGHYLQLERPIEFNQRLRTIIDSLDD